MKLLFFFFKIIFIKILIETNTCKKEFSSLKDNFLRHSILKENNYENNDNENVSSSGINTNNTNTINSNNIKNDSLKNENFDSEILPKNGSVASEVPLCSKMGLLILKNGGNAIDSGITTTICIGIINSFSSGIGGGGFSIVKIKDKALFFDFREQAPKNVNIDHMEKNEKSSEVGGCAIAIPGEVRGLYEIHKKFGFMSWKELFKPNIELAGKGFTVSKELRKRMDKFKKTIMIDNGLRQKYTKEVNGETILKSIGDKVVRRNYSNTLMKISNNPIDFYSGELAKNIVEAVKSVGGSIELNDMANYRVKSSKPLMGTYKNYKIITGNLPTSGIFEILGFNILENFNLKKIKERYGEKTIYHLLIEILKFMSAKRGELSDPKFMKNKKIVKKLLSKEFAKLISKKINLNRPLKFEEYHQTASFNDFSGTSHINIVDKDNTIFMNTTSINLEFGCKFMDAKTGIIFNNSMNDFYIKNNINAYDLGEMTANNLEPNKRPFSSMSPTILENENETIILGATGGTRIYTSVFSVIYNLFLGKSLKESINLPRIHHQLTPNFTFVEKNLKKNIFKYLEEIGQNPKVSELNSIFTSVQGTIIYKNGKIESYSDPRKGGKSEGY